MLEEEKKIPRDMAMRQSRRRTGAARHPLDVSTSAARCLPQQVSLTIMFWLFDRDVLMTYPGVDLK